MLHEIRIILSDELKQSLRNRKLIFLVIIYALLWLAIKLGLFIEYALYVLLKPPAALPHTLLTPFYFMVIILPILAIALSYDSISKETQNKHIRFLATKASRLSIVLGNFLSNTILVTIFLFITLTTSVIFTYLNNQALLIKEPFIMLGYLTLFTEIGRASCRERV